MKRTRRFAASLVVLGLAAQAGVASADGGAIERLDPRLDRVVRAGTVAEKVVDGLVWVEGPAWNARERALYFSDIPRNAVLRWTDGRAPSIFLQPSGYSDPRPFSGREPGSNGLVFDREGRLVLCQHGDRRIVRREHDGAFTVLADRWQGKRLNSPNDVVFRPGTDEIYFTDPPFGLPGAFADPAREIPWSGVYRRRSSGELELLTKELRAPNGIAFSPDGTTLYVSNAERGRAVWMAYPVEQGGGIGAGRVLADATNRPRTPDAQDRGNPDGIEVDGAGNLFTAGPGGLLVIAPDGTLLGVIATGITSNAEWGDDGRTLYVTADHAIWRIRTETGKPREPGNSAADPRIRPIQGD